MSNRNFRQLLEARQAEGKFVCVGLDADRDKILNLPVEWETRYYEETQFLKRIVEATHEFAGAYKPNIAFFEGADLDPKEELRDLISTIHELAPSVPVILDFKRGDIGNSNLGYIRLMDDVEADAVTVHGYMGQETWQPLLDRPDKGVFVLCRTSNPGAAEFQERDVVIELAEYRQLTGEEPCGDVAFYRMPLYEYVALRVAKKWNINGNCGLVVGATVPEQLKHVRELAPDLPLLIPGIGKQGGDLEAAVKNGMNAERTGIIINASSSILYASSGHDFAEAARAETQRLTDEINKYREVVRA